jgi:hypothetical protein
MRDTSVQPPASPPRVGRSRRLYYGWVLVGAQVSSWGVLYYAFSVVLEPIQRELGWSR